MNLEHPLLNKLNKIGHLIRKHKRYVIGGIALIGIGYSQFFGSGTSTTQIQKTYVVASGSIENSIKVLGDTKITNQQTLTFGYEGTVKKLYVKEGDAVKKGQLLAEIDKKDLQKNIAQQSLSLQSTRISYQKALNQITEGDKLGAQNSVDDAQAKLTAAKKQLEDMMLSKGDTLQTSSSQVQSIILSTKNMILDTKNILENIDKVFGITNKYKYINEDIAIYIGAKDSSSRYSTENYYNQSINKLSTVESTLSIINNNSITTIQALQALQDKNKDFLNTLSTAVDYSLTAAKASIVSTDLTQSQIDGWASTFVTASSKVISYLSSTNTNVNSLKTTENDIVDKKNEIKNLEAQLQIKKETLQTTLNGLSREDRMLQENSIKQGQISLSKLQEQTIDYELRAPFDGNIDVITFKQGDNIANDNISSEGITISNPNFYEINMLIDQVDIVKIKKGQLANVTFDAYPGYTVTGEITNIDPTPVESAGVVSYTAIISMVKGEKKIYDKMTVNIEIITEQKKDIIVVPTTAIKTKGTRYSVQVSERGKTVIKPVVIGLNDTFNTEIISGLNLGEIVFLEEYTTVGSKDKNTDFSSMGSKSPAQEGMSSMRGLGVGGSSSGFPRN